jgi:hypothetical protein
MPELLVSPVFYNVSVLPVVYACKESVDKSFWCAGDRLQRFKSGVDLCCLTASHGSSQTSMIFAVHTTWALLLIRTSTMTGFSCTGKY